MYIALHALSYFLTCMYFSNRSANNNVTTRSMNSTFWMNLSSLKDGFLHSSLKLSFEGKNHVHCLHIKRQDATYYGICQDTENMASPSMDIYLIFYGNRELNCQPKWRIAAIQIQVLSFADCLHDMLFRDGHVECTLASECSCTHTACLRFAFVIIPESLSHKHCSLCLSLAVTNMDY